MIQEKTNREYKDKYKEIQYFDPRNTVVARGSHGSPLLARSFRPYKASTITPTTTRALEKGMKHARPRLRGSRHPVGD